MFGVASACRQSKPQRQEDTKGVLRAPNTLSVRFGVGPVSQTFRKEEAPAGRRTPHARHPISFKQGDGPAEGRVEQRPHVAGKPSCRRAFVTHLNGKRRELRTPKRSRRSRLNGRLGTPHQTPQRCHRCPAPCRPWFLPRTATSPSIHEPHRPSRPSRSDPAADAGGLTLGRRLRAPFSWRLSSWPSFS